MVSKKRPPESIRFSLGERHSYVEIGQEGWAYFQLADWTLTRLAGWFRFTETPHGRIRIVALALETDGEDPIYARDIVAIPLGRITDALNSPGLVEQLRERAAEYGDTEPRIAEIDALARPVRHVLEVDVPLVDAHLPVPLRGAKYPDDFYRRVGEVFGQLVAQKVPGGPAKAIAEANGVPTSTVHRWIKEARQRGIVPPSRRSTGGAK